MQVPGPFEYERASSVEQAIGLLERLGSSARLVAGGHSLLPMMKLRLTNFEYLIDINDLHDELGYVRVETGQIPVGAPNVLMGAAMAGMALSRLNVLPTVAWEAIFGAEALWFALAMARSGRVHDPCSSDGNRARRACHCATHTVMAVCMLYMYLGRGPGGPGHEGMPMAGGGAPAALGAGGDAWLSLLFVAVLVVSAACEMSPALPLARAAALSTAGLRVQGATAPRRHALHLEAASHVAMSLVMGYMLVVMG